MSHRRFSNRAALVLGLACSTAFSSAFAIDLKNKPDFTGVWQIAPKSNMLRPIGGGEAPLSPEGKKLRDEFKAKLAEGDKSADPINVCKPPGNPRTMLEPMPFEITERPNEVFFGYQWNHLTRFVDWSDTMPPAPGWTWYGNSAASWDGNTLVIRSHGYQEAGKTFLDGTGLPSGDKLELTERYTLKNNGKQMELRLTVNDPQMYSKPWDAVVTFNKLENTRIEPDVCTIRNNMIKTN